MGLIKRQEIYEKRQKAKNDTPVKEQKSKDCMPYCDDCITKKEYENSHRGSYSNCIACQSGNTILIYHKFSNEVSTDGFCDTYEYWEYKCKNCEKYFLISEYGNYRNFYIQCD